MANPSPTRADLLRLAWTTGRLRYLLSEEQCAAYDAIWSLPPDQLEFFLHWSRRLGKDHLGAVLAAEVSIRFPGFRTLVTHPVESVGAPIFMDVMENFILPDCPEDLRPRILDRGHTWIWPNRAEILVRGIGTQKEVDRARGPRAGLWLCTEAGFCDFLDEARSALLPLLMGQGKIGFARAVIQCNAATDSEHSFFRELDITASTCPEAVSVQDIYKTTRYTEAEIAAMCRTMGGKASAKWQREYLCVRVADSSLTICPGFAPRADQEWEVQYDEDQNPTVVPTPGGKPPLVRTIPKPQYAATFTVADIAYAPHHTFVISGWYDWDAGTLVFAGERDLVSADYDELAKEIEAVEEETLGEHWRWLQAYHPHEPELRVHTRWMDVDSRSIAELGKRGLQFASINNKDPEAMDNILNTRIHQGGMAVWPKCASLQAQLRVGRYWNQTRTRYGESKKYGHWDGVAAARIATANVPTLTCPMPRVKLEHRGRMVIDPADFLPDYDSDIIPW